MQVLDKILPQQICDAVSRVNQNTLQEIRLRAGKPPALLIDGKKCFLGANGNCINRENALCVNKKEIDHILLNACEHSLHAYSEQMSQGFIMLKGGVRLGVCGTAVTNGGKIVSFKDVSSLNIRIPHEIRGCSAPYSSKLLQPLQNVLIISRPGAGKTTFLRDLVLQSSYLNNPPNVLVADERNEIAGGYGGEAQFDLGDFCDVIALTSKHFAFESGLRTMAPDIIACDEIIKEDADLLQYASNCGVKLFASIHAEDINELRRKEEYGVLLDVFDKFAVLSARRRPGEVVGIFDSDMKTVM